MERPMPKLRRYGPLRFRLATWYHCVRRREWRLGGARCAKPRPGTDCPFVCATHQTPLTRNLNDANLWMQENKVRNLRLAVARLDGLTLLPGETFSYWKRIGNPTRRKGYREGILLRDGTVVPGVGGGLCQCSNLIYWLALHTPLTVTERFRHGYDVFPDSGRTQPFGTGATCFYHYMDLMLHNDTDQIWRLCLQVTDTHLVGEWRSNQPAACQYTVFEKEQMMRAEYWGDFTRHNQIFRKVFDLDGTQCGEEYVTENHTVMMYAPFLPPTEITK